MGMSGAFFESALGRRVRFVLSMELMDELIQDLHEKFQVNWEMLWAYSFRLSQFADVVKAKKLSDLAARDREDVKVLEWAEAGLAFGGESLRFQFWT